MRYQKGAQSYALDDLPKTKILLVANADSETPWVAQADTEVVLLNDVVAFMPFRTWGVVLPSAKSTKVLPEIVDVTALRGTAPDNVVLVLHPEAWDQYVQAGYIDDSGELAKRPKQ